MGRCLRCCRRSGGQRSWPTCCSLVSCQYTIPFLAVFCIQRTLELRLAERWGVAGDDDKLGLAGAEGLEGRLVTKSDLTGLWERCQHCRTLHSPALWGLRTLIVKASLALMLSDVLVLFFGAIVLVLSPVALR